MLQEKIELALLIFLFGWMITTMLSKSLLMAKKFKLLNYICQKCITFWGGLVIALFQFDFQNAVLISLCAAFAAHIYQEKID
jgi:hypothetical protein